VGEIRLGEPLRELTRDVSVVLATGGFQGDRELVRRHITPEAGHLLLRANPWSAGDGLRLALEQGAKLTAGMDEFYGRNLAAAPQISPQEFVELAQVYARLATVANAHGETYEPRTWSEIDVVQWTALQPGARAWYRVPADALSARVRDRSVAEMIDGAEAAGAPVEREDGDVTVEVRAGITTTLGGIRIDERAEAVEGLFVAGADAGGISTGGYSSGLAAALVFGRIAAESALR
jgi:succinate dehydrogenase/fumarate reductase flavoprotein subunit